MKVIAIGGVPGSGKSTLVRHLIETTTTGPRERFAEGVFGHKLPDWSAIVLGTYDDPEEMFPGTDKLSMAAHGPSLWLLEKLGTENQTRTVIFEGDRLFSSEFLASAAAIPGVSVQVVMIEATPDTLKQRRTERGSNQSAAFLKGRKTKVLGVVNNARLRSFVVCLPNNTEQEHQRALAMLGKWIDPSQATRKRF